MRRETESEKFNRQNTQTPRRPSKIAHAKNINGFGTRWDVTYSDDPGLDRCVSSGYLDLLERDGYRVERES